MIGAPVDGASVGTDVDGAADGLFVGAGVGILLTIKVIMSQK